MYLAKIYVTHKPSILDPQGEAITNALHRLDYQTVESISLGKFFQAKLDLTDKATAQKTVESICQNLLVNHNMETYRYELKEV